MKQYYFLVASLVALASCSSDDFVGGDNGSGTDGNNVAIRFDGDAGKITRATSNTGTTQLMLDGQFKVYGVKSGTTAGSDLAKVFIDYSVWDNNDKTTSNTKGWEYVGEANATGLGTGSITLGATAQTIKYWDYSAADYRFVAGSPISAFTYEVNSNNVIEKAKITGLGGHINANTSETALATDPVYVASPVIVEKANYRNPVQFKFVRQQAMVRVGVYETIPGYAITDIKFYAYDTDGSLKVTTNNNVILTSTTADYFVGGQNVSGTITYDWDNKSFSLAYDEGSLTKEKNWYAGALADGVKAKTSNLTEVADLYGTDKDMSTTGYFTVLPTPAATTASAIQIKCDYTLKSVDGSGETIKVTGATAAIPAAFSKWEANTMYTYIFKISQNTNGTTGGADDQVGLFPITFDATVIDAANAQGTVTTFTSPTITTYQIGSTDNGIKYTTTNPIYATVADQDGVLKDLTTKGTEIGNVEVYKLSKEYNEADLQVTEIANAEIKADNKQNTTVIDAATTVNGVSFEASKALHFTPEAAGYYAIQYKYAADTYTYKVVTVE